MAITRRRALGAVLLTAAGTAAGTTIAGCTGARREPRRWHDGRLYLATGNTTGVFYQLGGGYADIITRHLPGYEATAEPTNAAVDNVRRLVRGDADIALTFADVAADAVTGRVPFNGSPQPIQALARIYHSYAHVIARTGTGIRRLADLHGHRVSTGSPGSGTENMALRLLSAAGIEPDRELTRLSLSLPATVAGMKNGSIDAMFWTAGLPTLGISDLTAAMRDRVLFLPTADLLGGLRQAYGAAYTPAMIGRAVYNLGVDVPTIAVASLVVVGTDLPDLLGFELTRLLFDYQDELAAAHPEGRNFGRDTAPRTEPVPLHPGARRYYGVA
jgi:TRAP transporter TAXI family solute receptor